MASEGAQLLKQGPLFSDLDDRGREAVAGSMKHRTFSSGQQIAVEGESGVGFFVIEDGAATVTVHGDEVRRLGPGDYFGEIALIGQSPRAATVTADSELKTYAMTFWDFRPLVEETPGIAWKLLQGAVKQYDQSQQQ